MNLNMIYKFANMQLRLIKLFIVVITVALYSCNRGQDSGTTSVLKGLYSFGPDAHSLKDCDNGREYWVTDKSNQLELQYSHMIIEKPYVPVYVEVEGTKVKSGKDGMGSEFDSTIVVTKLIKITKEIPQDMCN